MENEEKEGLVADLIEKMGKGKLTAKEAIAELERRGLTHHAKEPIPGVFAIIGITVWGILCFLPTVARDLGTLNFLAQLPAIKIPAVASFSAIIFAIAVTPLAAYSHSIKIKKGGCRHEDHTIILIKEGPYGILRHPEVFVGLIWLVAIPIILSPLGLSFTFLSILGEAVMILALFLQAKLEEQFNVLKWSNEYRRYQEEVPRFNLILGIWRWTRRKRSGEKS